MRAIAEEASAELVRKYKGAYSGEHGDGLCRGEWIEWQFGPAQINEALRAIKQHLDPDICLFNPGKIIDPPKMDDGSLLRFAPADALPSPTSASHQPVLDWSAWNVQADPVTEVTTAPGTGGDRTGGFAKAVEMCNNNGHCRKFDAGTMCPSYRVTRDEQHLTRGRANTLRLAHLRASWGLTPSPARPWHDTMDLVRGLQGLQARLPHGRGHGPHEGGIHWPTTRSPPWPHAQGPAGRPSACATRPRPAAWPWLLNLRRHACPCCARRFSEKLAGPVRPGARCHAWRSDTFWRAPGTRHTFA